MKMNITSLIATVFLSAFSFSATAATMTPSQSSLSANTANSGATQKTDGQIIEMLIVINTNEINAANEALQRTINPDVRNFAHEMITAHTANLQAFQNLSQKLYIAPVSTQKSEDLQNKGQQELKTLDATASSKFDITYANAMVKGHEAVLNVIDKKLLPNVTNPGLKTLLTNTRATVAQHLEMAKTLQSELTK